MRKASPPQADLYEVNEVAADLLRRQAADLVAGLSRTRQEVVRRVLAQGVKRGWSDAVLRDRLAQVVGLDPRRADAVARFRQGQLDAGVPPSRAERQTKAYAKRLLKQRVQNIARHETRQALMNAQRLVWREMQDNRDYSPYAVRVTVVHKDERACPTCKPQNGRRRSLQRDLTDGPPFHPQCRCDEVIEDRGVEKMLPDSRGVYIPGPLPHLSTVEGAQPKKRRKKREDDESMGPMTVSKAMERTPGGRMGNTASLDRSPKKNWVERAGGLPKYIRMVAHAMERKGHPRSAAIRLAIGIVRNWAQGKGKVSPKVRAAAAKAIAEFEAKAKGASVSKAEATTWNMDDYQDIVKQLQDEGSI